MQMLPGRTRATLKVRQFANLLFQRQYQDNLNLATSRTKRILFDAQKSLGPAELRLFADTQAPTSARLRASTGACPGSAPRAASRAVGRGRMLFGFDATRRAVADGAPSR